MHYCKLHSCYSAHRQKITKQIKNWSTAFIIAHYLYFFIKHRSWIAGKWNLKIQWWNHIEISEMAPNSKFKYKHVYYLINNSFDSKNLIPQTISSARFDERFFKQ